MDFDFLDRQLFDATRQAIADFKGAVEGARPSDREINDLCARISRYTHARSIPEDFVIGAVDGSGEFPVLQQDDIFMHFVVAAGATFQTATARQHKLSSLTTSSSVSKQYVLLSDDQRTLTEGYRQFFEEITDGMTLKEFVAGSDYCEVFSQFSTADLSPGQVSWDNFPFAKASQIATHAYLLRSMAELAMAIRILEHRPRYLLIDTSLVYFLLGETPYLPELMKRFLITRANAQGTALVALCKSHNLPNGDLIARIASDDLGLKDHWFLRLPSAALREKIPLFLSGREIPPKLSVSYLFKFEATSFPLRIDVDAGWWRANIDGDIARERQFFSDLDFTCHEVRSYGYPYPMHAAHRSASLTRQERKALQDILTQHAQREGLLRGSVAADPEELHMSGL